eukprot:jgi/Mesvir1/6250/Mv00969-RA.1
MDAARLALRASVFLGAGSRKDISCHPIKRDKIQHGNVIPLQEALHRFENKDMARCHALHGQPTITPSRPKSNVQPYAMFNENGWATNVVAVHVSIQGHVQGVGYRAWLLTMAKTNGLDGWVRNRRDGSVEAVLIGSDARVRAVLNLCRHGPGRALVSSVDPTELGEEAIQQHGPRGAGFQLRNTF